MWSFSYQRGGATARSRPTAGSRKLEVGRRRKWLECKRLRCAPLWHVQAHHFETRAVRRASGAVCSYAELRRDDPAAVARPSSSAGVGALPRVGAPPMSGGFSAFAEHSVRQSWPDACAAREAG